MTGRLDDKVRVEHIAERRKEVIVRGRDAQPTNERIVTMLEAISRQLSELQKAQKEMASEAKRVARSSR